MSDGSQDGPILRVLQSAQDGWRSIVTALSLIGLGAAGTLVLGDLSSHEERITRMESALELSAQPTIPERVYQIDSAMARQKARQDSIRDRIEFVADHVIYIKCMVNPRTEPRECDPFAGQMGE